MPFIPADKTVQVEMRYVQNSSQMENVFYVHKESLGDVDATYLGGLADIIKSAWTTYFKPIISTGCTLVEIYLRDLTALEAIEFTESVNDVGTAAGSLATGQDTLCVSFRTGFTGRSARGRSYFISLRQTDIVNDIVSVGKAQAIVDAWAEMMSEINASLDGAKCVVLSRFTEGAPRTEGQIRDITTVTAIDRIVDSQNNRLTGRGQ